MDVAKLNDIAAKLRVPGLVAQGVAFIAEVQAAAALSAHVIADGDWAELDAIHTRALAAATELDEALEAVQRR